MRRVKHTLHGARIVIEGAERLVWIEGPKARRLEVLKLHHRDLNFAQECIQRLSIPAIRDDPVLGQGAWQIALIRLMKCYGDSQSRFPLVPKKVLANEPAMAMEAFHYFKNLRNFHLAHDSNPFSIALTMGVIPAGASHIDEILAFGSEMDRSAFNMETLKNLIDVSLEWVEDESKKLEKLLLVELGNLSKDEIMMLPSAVVLAATHGQIEETRWPGDKASSKLTKKSPL